MRTIEIKEAKSVSEIYADALTRSAKEASERGLDSLLFTGKTGKLKYWEDGDGKMETIHFETKMKVDDLKPLLEKNGFMLVKEKNLNPHSPNVIYGLYPIKK